MNEHLRITLNNKSITALPGTTIAQMLALHPHTGAFPAIGAVVDNRMSGLNRAIRHHATIETIDMSSREGMEIYRRTAGMLFYAAVEAFDPKAKVVIGQSIDEGYCFDTIGFEPTPAVVKKLETLMHALVAENRALDPDWIPIEEAIQIFEKRNRPDRVLLLRQIRRSDVPLLTIAHYIGYVHGPIAPHTGIIDRFKLHPYENGLVLEFPNAKGELAGTIAPRPKLFATYTESRTWRQLMQVENVAQLNELTSKGQVSEMIKVAEALHEKKIAAIADQISGNRDMQFVFIAGPSSSGKTTFTKRLAIQLQVCGIRPIALSLDNYYLDREQSPRHADGTFNFESIEALDLPLLNDQLSRLMKRKLVETPLYSFPRGRRIQKTVPMQLTPGQVVLIEGIHGLNNRLSAAIPANHKFKIFISALTQLCIDDHNRIFTSDSRLIRRMIRDRRYRGTNAADTILGWPSVRAGESEWINPFQEDADAIFDSSLCYEQAVLKNYAERFLTEIPKENPAYVEALRLFRFFDLFVPLQSEDVPTNSILREFTGGSSFRY